MDSKLENVDADQGGLIKVAGAADYNPAGTTTGGVILNANPAGEENSSSTAKTSFTYEIDEDETRIKQNQ